MAVAPAKSKREGQSRSHPLLMDHTGNLSHHDHTIDIPRNDVTSPSASHHDDLESLDEFHDTRSPPDEVPAVPERSSVTYDVSDSQNASSARRDRGHRQQNPLNSGFWISIELIVNLSQIIAATCVLSVSRNEHPHAPLFEWVIGYTIGGVATLPHLYWRYLHRNHLATVQESANQNYIPNNIPESNSFEEFSAPRVSEAGVVTGTNGVSRNNVVTVNPRYHILHFGYIIAFVYILFFLHHSLPLSISVKCGHNTLHMSD